MSGQRYASKMLDISGGLQSGVSDYGIKTRHVTRAENVEFRPYRACSVRKGSQRATSATMTAEGHTLMEWVAAAGTSNKYVVQKGGVSGTMIRMTPTLAQPQALPITLGPATWLSWDQLNGAIFATENSGTNHPMFYRSTNVADTWLDCVYPTPGATLTLTPAVAATGAVAPNWYAYRLRHLFADGSSQASTPQTVQIVGPNNRTAVTTIPLAPVGRTDWVGWILERTQGAVSAAAALTLPFYYVAGGTANAYNDDFVDGDLGYASNDNWYRGVPGGHVDGIIAMADRLAAWAGSTLYVSQPIADPSGAGILNFDGNNGYDFGAGDGDTITAVVKQNDRLIVFKQNSVWAFEGNDPSNFSVTPLYHGAGAAGLRAAASAGSLVWFYGSAGLHQMAGSEIKPWGYTEIGDVVDAFFLSRSSEVVVKNHVGKRVLIAHSQRGAYNDTVLVNDLRYRQWGLWTGIRATDILVPKVADFGDRDAFLTADPKDFDPTASNDYRVWIANWGAKDERAADGSGGTDRRVALRTPWIDDGQPDVEKVFEWLQVYAGGQNVTLTAQIETDPPTQVANLSLPLPATGELWGAFTWGDGTVWGSPPAEASAERGIPTECTGRRYRITYIATVPNDFSFRGHVVNAVIQPRKRKSP